MFFLTICTGAVAQNKPFWHEIQQFKKRDSVSMPAKNGIVFVGSSSLRMWKDLETTYKKYNAINRGFGGSDLASANLYVNELVIVHKPRQVVIYSGENDIANGVSADKTFERFTAFFGNIRKALPKTNITFVSIKYSPSRAKFSDTITKTNGLIKSYLAKRKNTGYIDITSKMLSSSGEMRPELFQSDMLHMKPEGYAIWTKEITPYLKKK